MKIKPTLTTLALMNLNLSAQIENQSSVNDFWAEIANTWATMVDKYLSLAWKEIYVKYHHFENYDWSPLATKPLFFQICLTDIIWSSSQYLSNELSFASIGPTWKTIDWRPLAAKPSRESNTAFDKKLPCPYTCLFSEFCQYWLGSGVNRIFQWFFIEIKLNKYWLKTIPNESKREICLDWNFLGWSPIERSYIDWGSLG